MLTALKPVGRQSDSIASPLMQLFQLLDRSLGFFMSDAGGEHFAKRWLRFGALDGGTLGALLDHAERDRPIDLKAPFEGVDSIAGGLWLGADIAGPDRCDGIAKLRFRAGTLDLPIHAHEHSDRLIVVLSGSGVFHVSNEQLDRFTGSDVRHISVHVGDVLMFTRHLLHTFSAPKEDLLLLSYHSPAIAFDDDRQYTVPDCVWRPRDLTAEVRYA